MVTTKHHEGFTLWPSKVRHPGNRTDLNCQVDLLGKLSKTLRERDIRFGVYYSGGVDWSIKYPGTPSPKDEMYEDYALAHLRELIGKYRPDVLWNDFDFPKKFT